MIAREYAIPRVPVNPEEGVVIVTAVLGVAEVEAVGVPAPAELRALSCTLYAVKFVSPVITKGEVVTAGEGVVQFTPPFVE